jgi:hypothetical protein
MVIAEVSLTLSLHPVRLPFIPLSHSLISSLGAVAQKMELTEKGITSIVDENCEAAERVLQEIRLNITTMRSDIQVALFDLSSFVNLFREFLFRSLSLPLFVSLSQVHKTALERVEQQGNLAKQKAEDATNQAQEGLREAKATQLPAQVPSAPFVSACKLLHSKRM